MQKALINRKVAIIVANGFKQGHMLDGQRILSEMGADIRIISTEQGVVMGWNGTGWGNNFAVDASLNTALGTDFDILIIPGGRRSHEKLRLTAHSKRFISSFIDTGKQVILMDNAVSLPLFLDLLRGRSVAGPEIIGEFATKSGAVWSGEEISYDKNIMSGAIKDGASDKFINAVAAFLLKGLVSKSVHKKAA